MHFIIQIIFTIILTFILESFMPWWSIALSSFIIPLFLKINGFKVFLGGFTSISSLWMGYAAIIDVQTNYIISSKISPLFGFNSSILLVLLTGILGGFVGGFFALSGSCFKSIFKDSIKSKSEFGYLSD